MSILLLLRQCSSKRLAQAILRYAEPKTMSCGKNSNPAYSCSLGSGERSKSTNKSEYEDEKWRSKLTEDEYHVAREHGTEPPFTGKYYKQTTEGVYTCVCCESDLFSSKSKYDSGSGWPSFYDELKSIESDGSQVTGIKRQVDDSLGVERIEILCKNCGSHLGHVFDDGPQPTGERYCVNSLSLKFRPEKK